MLANFHIIRLLPPFYIVSQKQRCHPNYGYNFVNVSNMTFCHLSNTYLSNVMKTSAKIITMQNINILLVVRSLSVKQCRVGYRPSSINTVKI